MSSITNCNVSDIKQAAG